MKSYIAIKLFVLITACSVVAPLMFALCNAAQFVTKLSASHLRVLHTLYLYGMHSTGSLINLINSDLFHKYWHSSTRT